MTEFAGIVRTCYPDGQLKEIYFENRGKKEGEYKEYRMNGKLLKICTYVD